MKIRSLYKKFIAQKLFLVIPIRSIIFMHDALMVSLAWIGAYWLRYNLSIIPGSSATNAKHFLPIILSIQAICFLRFGLYRGIWRFASLPDLLRILKSIVTGVSLSMLALFVLNRFDGIPRSVFPMYAMLLIGFVSAPRCFFRWYRDYVTANADGKRVLIIGAGGGGEALLRNLIRNDNALYTPIAIADDDPNKLGMEIHGIRVVGATHEIPEIVKQYEINQIFLAIPSADSSTMRRIVEHCENANVPVSTLPTFADLVTGRVSIKELRDVSLVDLLGRDQVSLDWDAITQGLSKQCIMITGAGGSIGSELTRQLASLHPEQLVLIDNSEFNLYSIENEIRGKFPELNCMVHLESIADRTAMMHLFQQYKPQSVFHAAAFKHVPLLQAQIRSAVSNNVIGTNVLAEVATLHAVERFVLISTDKAVNPLNIMGITKRFGELICQHYNQNSKTQFITVRFGNVLGSAGSVIPLFQKQLQLGGPLTVTHPDMTRYFMTIPEASLLILQASVMGQGGELFVLDMGEPVKITYLAEQLIRLSGKQVGKDIKIIYTGLRPGEKLTEELFFSEETLLATAHKKIQKTRQDSWVPDNLMELISQLNVAIAAYDESAILEILQTIATMNQPTRQQRMLTE